MATMEQPDVNMVSYTVSSSVNSVYVIVFSSDTGDAITWVERHEL